MTAVDHALLGLRHALDAPRRHSLWRQLVRNRLAGLKDALAAEHSRGEDAWLAAREAAVQREREGLVRRITELSPRVVGSPDIERLRGELHRLVADVERHGRRLNDLVYDSVSLELGGSE